MIQKQIELIPKIRWAFQKKEELGVKILILVGGRSSTKSTAAADVVLSFVQAGQRWCNAREYYNSIDDSCHALLKEEIERLEFEGFGVQDRCIKHVSNGEIFYKGLNRNPDAIKSTIADGIWIEEGSTLSQKTIDVLSKSFRVSAAKRVRAERLGEEAKLPFIIITMNRGSRNDPISKEYLIGAESDIAKQGWHADENVLIVEVNYTDMPKSWFIGSGLESERLRDERTMSTARYRHVWHGDYSDSIDDAIIEPEWFDACIDAHVKLEQLGNWFGGQERVAFDPADVGDDPEALAHARGSVIVEAMQHDCKDIEKATNWATSYANEKRVDAFLWDCDGMGVGLKFQIAQAFKGKKFEIMQFKGSEGAYKPDAIYMPVDEEQRDAKTNKDTFANQRAQFYADIANAMYKTYLAVERGRFFSVDELVSFSSSITHINLMRSELCRIPRKYVTSGKFLLYTKQEMLKMGISSPNIADSVMMTRKPVEVRVTPQKLNPVRWG